MKKNVPSVSKESQALSNKLKRLICDEIDQNGPMAFARYMDLALYHPQYGYYRNGSIKFGRDGDFITAPETSPLFAKCLAVQCQEVFSRVDRQEILEFGAGTGALALELLSELRNMECLPAHYYILELSAELADRQRTLLQENIPALLERVVWVSDVPQAFSGVMIANEVVDAMPVNKFVVQDGETLEIYVTHHQQELAWWRGDPKTQQLQSWVDGLGLAKQANYESEVNMYAAAWLHTLAVGMEQGLILVIDYGYVKSEYYHPQRDRGTIMCHYKHRAHDDPLSYPGIQDITAHVDFTALAYAAHEHDLWVAGFTHQAAFLYNCGIANMAKHEDTVCQYRLAQALKTLTLPSEMGEIFKVMAMTKGIDSQLVGFAQNDLRQRL